MEPPPTAVSTSVPPATSVTPASTAAPPCAASTASKELELGIRLYHEHKDYEQAAQLANVTVKDLEAFHLGKLQQGVQLVESGQGSLRFVAKALGLDYFRLRRYHMKFQTGKPICSLLKRGRPALEKSQRRKNKKARAGKAPRTVSAGLDQVQPNQNIASVKTWDGDFEVVALPRAPSVFEGLSFETQVRSRSFFSHTYLF